MLTTMAARARPAAIEQLNLVVADVDASVAFYRLVGLDLPDEAVWRTATGAHHVHGAAGAGVQLELDSEPLGQAYGGVGDGGPGSRVVVGVALPSREAVDERFAELTAAGHRGRRPPFDAFWGARYAVVDDPDGNGVGLMSPIDPDRRSAPPEV
jgi:uncharacterized glyoxalase superfamily protein PhnB